MVRGFVPRRRRSFSTAEPQAKDSFTGCFWLQHSAHLVLIFRIFWLCCEHHGDSTASPPGAFAAHHSTTEGQSAVVLTTCILERAASAHTAERQRNTAVPPTGRTNGRFLCVVLQFFLLAVCGSSLRDEPAALFCEIDYAVSSTFSDHLPSISRFVLLVVRFD